MVALQAQDRPMAKWAIGIRALGASDRQVEEAIAAGEIVRTHALRPTYQFVSSDNLRWLTRLSAKHIKAVMRTNDRRLELSEKVYGRCLSVIEKVSREEKEMTRKFFRSALTREGIGLDENRLSHILVRAEIEELLYGGALAGTQPTYSLLEGNIPPIKDFKRDEALARLAKAYFSTRGPATLRDFSWWAGLGLREGDKAIESLRPDLSLVKCGETDYWVYPSDGGASIRPDLMLLPSYDELLISYADRSAFLHAAHTRHTISTNGIFRPPVMWKGIVVGTWSRTTGKNDVRLLVSMFERCTPALEAKITKAAEQHAAFLEKGLELCFAVVTKKS
jgi:hypothetical protein